MADNDLSDEQARQISDYLTGTCEVDFREDDTYGVFRTYSGRGMYGKYCLGMDLDGTSDMFEIAMNLAEALIRVDADYELVDAFKRVRTDSMGMGIIIYWPNIQLVNESPEEDEEERTDEEYREEEALSQG